MGTGFVSKARGLIASSRYDEAEKCCRLGLEKHPDSVVGWLVLGAALMAQKEYGAAKVAMDSLLLKHPDQPMALAICGEACLKKGHLEAARQHLQKAVKISPEDKIIARLHREAHGKTPLPRTNTINLDGGPVQEKTVNLDAAFLDGRVEKVSEATASGVLARRTDASASRIELSTKDILLPTPRTPKPKVSSHGFYDDSTGMSLYGVVPPEMEPAAFDETNASKIQDADVAFSDSTLSQKKRIIADYGKLPEGKVSKKTSKGEPTDMRVIRSGVGEVTGRRNSLARLNRSKTWGRVLFGCLALLLLSSSVWAGLKIRKHRFSSDLMKLTEIADTLANDDSFEGWQKAHRLFKRAQIAKDTPRTRRLVGLSAAFLAANFGVNSENQVLAVQGAANDGKDLVEEGLWALAQSQPVEALQFVAQSQETSQTSEKKKALGFFVKGRAHLLLGDYEIALKEFREAIKIEQRPTFYVGLANSELILKKNADALASLSQAESIAGGTELAAATLLKAEFNVLKANQFKDSLLKIAKDETEAPEYTAMAYAYLSEDANSKGNAEKAKKYYTLSTEKLKGGAWKLQKVRVRALANSGNKKAAEELAMKTVELFPELPGPKIQGAELFLQSRQPEVALKILGTLDTKYFTFEALRAKSEALLAIGRHDQALDPIDRALAEMPDDPLALAVRANIELRQGHPEAAARRLKPIVNSVAPDKVIAVYALSLFEIGRQEEAIAMLTKRVEAEAKAFHSRLALARMYRQLGKRPFADKLYSQSVDEFPNDTILMVEWLETRYEMGQRLVVRESLNRLADHTKNFDILLSAARINIDFGDYVVAKKQLAAAEEIRGLSPGIVVEKARMALAVGQFDEAIQQLLAIADAVSEDAAVQLLLLEAYIGAKNAAGQVNVGKTLAKKFRGSYAQAMSRGLTDLSKGRNREARNAFERAIKVGGETLSALQKADTLALMAQTVRNEDPETAKTLLRQALLLDVMNPGANFVSGNIAFEEKDFLRAEKFYIAAIAANPVVTTKANYFLGLAEIELGNPKNAERALRSFIEQNPSKAEAKAAESALASLR